jgi:hypothetical protein
MAEPRRGRHLMLKIGLYAGVILLGICLLNLVIPFAWYSPRIEARVTGPDGKPIAGALVVANWNIQGPWDGTSVGQLALAEVTTGSDGRFVIPSWGPRLHWRGAVEDGAPALRIFKPGFLPRVINNHDRVSRGAADRIIDFSLQGKDIVLFVSSGSTQQYAPALNALIDSTAVLCGSGPNPCLWSEAPRLYAALYCLHERVDWRSAGIALNPLYHDVSSRPPQCGAVPFF